MDEPIATNDVAICIEEIVKGKANEEKEYTYSLNYGIVDKFLYNESKPDYITTKIPKSKGDTEAKVRLLELIETN